MSDPRPKVGTRKSNRGNTNERFQFLKPRSSSRNRSASRPSSTHSDSDSDSDPDNDASQSQRPSASTHALPSFSRSINPHHHSRRNDIEEDAIDTIQINSGNDLGDFDDGSDDEEDEDGAAHYNMHNGEEVDLGSDVRLTSPAGSSVSPRAEQEATATLYQSSEDDEKTDPKASGKNSPTDVNTSEAHSNPFINQTPPEDEKNNGDSSSDGEDKVDNFKRFFRRRSTTRRTSHDSRPSAGMHSLKEEGEDDDQGFFNKFLQYTGGGMTPGLERSSTQKSRPDQEHISGQENLEEPVDTLDITDAAQQILQSHGATTLKDRDIAAHGTLGNNNTGNGGSELRDSYLDAAANNPSDGETMVHSGHESFFAPRVGHYDDIDNDDGFNPLMEDESFIAAPDRVRGGVLGSLLKLYQNQDEAATQSQISFETTPEPVDYHDAESVPLTGMTETGSIAPQPGKKSKKISFNTPSFAGMKGKASQLLSSEHLPNNGKLPNFKATRPKMKNVKSVAKQANKLRRKQNAEARITVHIAALLQRQRFILRLCKALMLYGAPTHRLEEYMVMTSRVLEIDGQFLYVPGCMVVSFGDATTRTSEVQLVRCAQGLNLWKLHQVHSVYKRVIHDLTSAEEANMTIDRILKEKNLYPAWVCVLLYGFCASMVTPFAFRGTWINVAVSFVIGLCVGCLQFIVSQRSSLYSNVFEVTASIVVSFCGRALGSIPNSDICFGATVQGSLALILPGFIILSGSLELQSRNLVAGSVRMFYAIIYSLFLGFGITLGAALFGWIYHDATNETTCVKVIPDIYKLLFVPAFSIGLALINQARWSQLPVMTFISCCGYAVTYGTGLHFKNSTEFTSAISAFVIGILGNLYSRIWKGLAVSAMLPGIFVQVPSGVASQSSLLAGVQSANAIVNSSDSSSTSEANDLSGSMSFGVTMIQVSIGISVGLFASTIFVYPFGKKKTSLFTL
ncbi:LANO_0B07360g1_1 [Lachancea nothofagi CBS 11611]|uniref:Pheromone-regulated membrane protein 10 n=1 Tax=Lachancea nothofagi CBS 11611 TaxID=1266666 RepID=A0A1G4IZM2_9SACH|nr:LANO_0B07360g1_1 [Lachancea nothofagi CBS 11611]